MAVSEGQQSKHAMEVKGRRDNVHKKVDELMDIIENPSTTDAQRKECEAALGEMNDKFNRVARKGGGQAFQEPPQQEQASEKEKPEPGSQSSQSSSVGSQAPGQSPGSPTHVVSPIQDKDKDKK